MSKNKIFGYIINNSKLEEGWLNEKEKNPNE